jgi:hypothetical protein
MSCRRPSASRHGLGSWIWSCQLSIKFHAQLGGSLRQRSEQWKLTTSEKFVPEALAVSGFTREQTLAFPEPEEVMRKFAAWVVEVGAGRPMFISDNNGFDWQFINWYFHHFTGANPFGFSSTNLGSLYKGLVHDTTKNFKHLRKTRHTHHPVDDAKGNAEALLAMRDDMELKIRLS